MSIGFSFTAPLKKPEQFWKALEKCGKAKGLAVYLGNDEARVNFCRMGDVYFTLETETKKPKLSVEAQTSHVGAGFHAAAIAFVDALVKSEGLSIRMEDETDYYNERDFEKMRREHFYSWLNNLVKISAESLEKGEMRNLCLCWNMDQYMPADVAGSVVTPVGRFSIKKICEQVEKEGIESFAEDFFLWNEREQDARFYRNSALAAMWEDCYFMPASRSEEDRQVNGGIIEMLEKSAELDKTLPFPKKEYLELCGLNGHPPIETESLPELVPLYPIGFRKDSITHSLGNIHFTIPGHFLFSYEDEGGHNSYIWYDSEEGNWRNLRMTALSYKGSESPSYSGPLFENTEEAAEDFAVGDGTCRTAYTGMVGEDGEQFYETVAQVLSGDQVTFITATYEKQENKQWARDVFQGIEVHLPKDYDKEIPC